MVEIDAVGNIQIGAGAQVPRHRSVINESIMAQFADANHIEGVAYHPDRYMDDDDEMRARCWVLFEEIDANKDHHM